MIDPISAFAAAQSAFTLTKKLIGAGRELHDVSKTLGSWYEACADLTKAESQRKNPTLLDKMSHGETNIEREAMEIIVRKKQLLQKEKDIKLMLDLKFGLGTYDEMLQMRRAIRKEREETVYRQMEAKRQIANNAVIGTLGFLILATLGGGVYLIALAV